MRQYLENRSRRSRYISDDNYQESLGDSGTDVCSSGGTEFSPLKVPELLQTILSMHAVLTVQWGC